jgi:hypothetical protein
MKPDWKDAPDFARYLAKDEDGRWFWFEEEPQPRWAGWWVDSGKCCRANHNDWRCTLEERPASKEVEE